MSPDLHNALSTTYTVDVSESETPSEAVIRAVAAVSGLDPVPSSATDNRSLDPLYTAIDVEALDALFRPGTDATVQFTYHGYAVTVHSEGRVVLDAPNA